MSPDTLSASQTQPEEPAPAPPAEPAAYEMKFLVPEALGMEVVGWARQNLTSDPHGDPALGYRTHTVYLDTPALDIYRRTGNCGRGKLRVRRYGTEPVLFLERKVRKQDQVRKRRTCIPAAEVAALEGDGTDWAGEWFRQRQRERGLWPVLALTYHRLAFVGHSGSEGPLRLTLDQQLRVIRAGDWLPQPVEEGLPILTGQTILELKFQAALPALFKRLVEQFRLQPSTVSKYRSGMAALGV